jgi:PAS domain S-box-containing protein
VELEHRFRAVFERADTAVLVVDLHARIIDVNPAAERMTGRPRHELVGRSIGAVAAPRDVEAHRQRWRELAAGRREHYDLPVTLRQTDGDPVPTVLTMVLVRDAAGHPSGGVGMTRPAAAGPRVLPSRRPSDAEAAVLTRLAAGRSIQQIADDLRLTRRGVDYRISQLRRKLRTDGPDGCPTTSAALVARAYALGILITSTWPPNVDRSMVHRR